MRYEDLAEARRRAARRAFKASYSGRSRYRVSRRSIDEDVRLGLLAREAAEAYLMVIEWRSF